MLTLEKSSPCFDTNANQTGVQEFLCVKRETNPDGKNVYLYRRTHATGDQLGKIHGYEVFTPTIKKAGTYPLPNGKSITYNEDFEEYPGASAFGKRAWFCTTLESAEKRFQQCLQRNTADFVISIPPSTEPGPEVIPIVMKGRGRPKVDRSPLALPTVEFSIAELAELNKVERPLAYTFINEQILVGKVHLVREERRSPKGPMTKIFAQVSQRA